MVLSQYVMERAAVELFGDDASGIGYLLKDRVADLDAFIDALNRVANGGSALDPDVVSRMLGRRDADELDQLTPREREVLGLIAEGRSNRGSPKNRRHRRRRRETRQQPAPQARHHRRTTDHRRVLAVLAFLQRTRTDGT